MSHKINTIITPTKTCLWSNPYTLITGRHRWLVCQYSTTRVPFFRKQRSPWHRPVIRDRGGNNEFGDYDVYYHIQHPRSRFSISISLYHDSHRRMRGRCILLCKNTDSKHHRVMKEAPTTEASQIHIYSNVEDKNCDKHTVRSERINVELTLKLASRKLNCQSYCCGYIFSRLYYIGDIRWKFTPSTLVLWSPSCPLQILPNKQTWRTWASSPKSTVVQFIFDKQGTPTRGTEITYAI